MENCFKTWLLLPLIFLIPTLTFAQTVDKIGLEGQYGFIIPHAEDLQAISSTNPVGVQLSYARLNTSKSSWEVCNCFHYLGLQLSIHDFGNAEVLGQANSVSGFFEPILWSRSSWELTLKSGIGFTYLTRVYDEETNPDNQFFSSPLSFLIFLQPKLNYRLTEKLDLNFSIIYNHISNGGQRQPNRGMNYPMAGLGLSYVLDRQKLPSYESNQDISKWNSYLDIFATNRKAGVEDQRKYLFGASLGTYYRYLAISALGGGTEVYNDQSLQDVNGGFFDGLITAPYISHHFIFGKFDFSQRFAYYLQKPSGYVDHSFYQRYIIQYGVLEKIRLGVGLKVHGHVAENIDFRLGWKF